MCYKIIYGLVDIPFDAFLRASAMLMHVLDTGFLYVRLSVRLSVTRWYCIKTAEHIVMPSSPPIHSDGVTPYGGDNRSGV